VSIRLVGWHVLQQMDTAMAFTQPSRVLSQRWSRSGQCARRACVAVSCWGGESYGVAVFGTSYVICSLPLIDRGPVFPANGICKRQSRRAGTAHRHFIAPVARSAYRVGHCGRVRALRFYRFSGFILCSPDTCQCWLFAMLAVRSDACRRHDSRSRLGHAALLAIGAYTSALLSLGFFRSSERGYHLSGGS